MTYPKDQMSGLVNELQSTSQLYPAIYIYIVGGYPEQVRPMVATIYGQYIYIWQSPEGGISGPIGKVVEKKTVDFPASDRLYRSIYPDLFFWRVV